MEEADGQVAQRGHVLGAVSGAQLVAVSWSKTTSLTQWNRFSIFQ
jgi:hypothetical protein